MKTLGVILYIVNMNGGMLLHDNYRTMEQCRKAEAEVAKIMWDEGSRRIYFICVTHYDFPEPQG